MAMGRAEKRLLTVKDVAAYLQVNQTTIYRLLRRSEIPAFKLGGDWRFNLESIDAWRLAAEARSKGRRKDDEAFSLASAVALEVPAALGRLHRAISQTVAPLAELQAVLPIIKRIAEELEDKRDASGEIARLYRGRAIPFHRHPENLLEFAPIAFGVGDHTRRLVSVNDAYCRTLGFSRKRLQRRPILDLVYEADRAGYATIYRKLLAGETGPGSIVGRGVTGEGAPILIRSHLWAAPRKRSGKSEYAGSILERIATRSEASVMFSQCAEDLFQRREEMLSRGQAKPPRGTPVPRLGQTFES